LAVLVWNSKTEVKGRFQRGRHLVWFEPQLAEIRTSKPSTCAGMKSGFVPCQRRLPLVLEILSAFVGPWITQYGRHIAHWPDPGGVGDQAAWVVDAFAALSGIDAALDAAQRRLAGGG
jgi:hypothetical protein